MCLTPKHPRADILTEFISLLNRIARVCFCLGSPFGFIRQRLSSCEGGEMRAEFGSRWRRHGLIEVSSRPEWSRGTARAETGELFSSLRRAFVPQQEPRRARISARSRSDAYPWIHCFLFFALRFFFFSQVKSWDFLYKYTVLEIIDYKYVV